MFATPVDPAVLDTDQILEDPDGIEWVDGAVALGIFVGAIVVGGIANRLVARAVRRTTANEGLARFLGRLTGGLVAGVGLVYALQYLGVRIAPLLGILGIGGLALAFALQDITENLISSVFLQVQKQFDIGDEIITHEVEGTVEDVNWRSVWIRTFDGELVVIPASMVFKEAVTNQTHREQRRTTLVVGVDYDTDLDVARSTLLESTRSTDGVLLDPRPPEVWVTEFGSSSIDLHVRYWHRPRRRDEFEVRDGVARNAKRALDAAGITIPFPQRVLQWREGEGAWADPS